MNGSHEEPSKKKLKFEDAKLEEKLSLKNLGEKVPVLSGRFRETEVTAYLLKDTLNRFRLVGPLSQVILRRSLHLPGFEPEKVVKAESGDGAESTDGTKFWSKFDRFLVSGVPAGFTFGLIVRDPRKVLPPKRGCAEMLTNGNTLPGLVQILEKVVGYKGLGT